MIFRKAFLDEARKSGWIADLIAAELGESWVGDQPLSKDNYGVLEDALLSMSTRIEDDRQRGDLLDLGSTLLVAYPDGTIYPTDAQECSDVCLDESRDMSAGPEQRCLAFFKGMRQDLVETLGIDLLEVGDGPGYDYSAAESLNSYTALNILAERLGLHFRFEQFDM